MGRTLLCSLAGAGVGFLVGYVGVSIVAGAEPKSDAGAIILFLGSFLAGAGAIAGAIIGGVADLREFFTKKDRATGQGHDQDN